MSTVGRLPKNYLCLTAATLRILDFVFTFLWHRLLKTEGNRMSTQLLEHTTLQHGPYLVLKVNEMPPPVKRCLIRK